MTDCTFKKPSVCVHFYIGLGNVIFTAFTSHSYTFRRRQIAYVLFRQLARTLMFKVSDLFSAPRHQRTPHDTEKTFTLQNREGKTVAEV